MLFVFFPLPIVLGAISMVVHAMSMCLKRSPELAVYLAAHPAVGREDSSPFGSER